MHKKLGGHKKVPKKVWRAKFTLLEANKKASLILNIPLSTTITLNHIKCNFSSYDCVLFYQVLQNSQYCLTNLVFQKIQKGTWKCLSGHFFAPGQWFGHPWCKTTKMNANPVIRDSGNDSWIPKIGSDNSCFSFILFLYPHVVPSRFSKRPIAMLLCCLGCKLGLVQQYYGLSLQVISKLLFTIHGTIAWKQNGKCYFYDCKHKKELLEIHFKILSTSTFEQRCQPPH